MTAKKAIFIFFAAVLLAGCIVDDRSDCIDAENANLILKFEYNDKEGKPIFADRIETVDLIVFDEYQGFYSWTTIPKSRLEEFQGAQMDLEPGDYYMICWGNNTPRGENNAYTLYHDNTETADPLHYAPDKRFADAETRTRAIEEGTWKVSVAPTGTTVDTMEFMSAHRTVNVYLKDFPGMNSPDNTVFPNIRINNLSEYYDFTLARGPETKAFVQTSYVRQEDGDWWCYAKFYIPHFDYDNDINVIIEGSGEYSFQRSVTMEQILEVNEVEEVYDGDDLVLHVELTYDPNSTMVQISIPEFIINDVDGKFD